jgi:tetratricopeptide (TPR) repeat protein
METVSRFAKWAVLGCLIAGAAALLAVVIVYYQQEQRSDSLRHKWDLVFAALKDKKRASEQVAALEKIAEDPEIKGSWVHAFILMELGRSYLEDAGNVKLYKDERNAALDKATKLFELLATNEPFKSNQTYGPAAAQNAALAYEQARKYDQAIKLLNDQLASDGMEAHYLYNPMLAQLGRNYWLRSLNEAPGSKEYESDRESARKKLTDALRSITKAERPEKWRETAEYVKSLVDKPGKALPDGKAPPEKPRAAEKVENKAAPAPVPAPGDAKAATPVPADAKAAPAPVPAPGDAKAATPVPADAKAAPAPANADKKDEPKKDEPKKDEKAKDDKDKKSELKKDGAKDSGEAEIPNLDGDPSAVPASASGHLTFAQIQKALKEGRPAFCGCPRCAGGTAVPAAARIAQ